MLKINFYLRDKQATNYTSIVMQVNKDRNRYKVSTGEQIRAKYWHDRNQKAKELIESPESVAINVRLGELEQRTRKIFQDAVRKGMVPSLSEFKDLLFPESVVQIQSSEKSFWDHYEDFVEYKRARVSEDVIKDYHNSLRKHLKAVELRMGKLLTFEALKNSSGGFAEVMENYLTYEALNASGGKGMAVNSIGKQFKNLKAFLNWCFDRDICTRFSTRHMETKKEEVEKVYLSRTEIDQLLALELPDSEGRVVRDLFVIGCETGLRFSDYSRIGPQHITEKRLEIVQKKTNDRVIIPISKRFRRVLNDYQNQLPQFDDLTRFNQILRNLCQQAGIDQPVAFTRTIGNRKMEITKPKYELVSSHSGRRSFCTNLFREDKVPAQVIMQISGHRTERAFMRYLKIDKEFAADEIDRLLSTT